MLDGRGEFHSIFVAYSNVHNSYTNEKGRLWLGTLTDSKDWLRGVDLNHRPS